MRKKLITIFALSATLTFADNQSKTSQVYSLAEQKLAAGDYDTAEKYLKAILKADPKHGNARFQLLQLDDLRAQQKSQSSKGQLNDVTIKKIDFQEISFSEAIADFKTVVDLSNGDAPAPNIAIMDPKNKISDKTVSLTLDGIPAYAALEHLASIPGARVKYEEHLIKIIPR